MRYPFPTTRNQNTTLQLRSTRNPFLDRTNTRMCSTNKFLQLSVAVLMTVTSTLFVFIGKTHQLYEMDHRYALCILIISLNITTTLLFWSDKFCRMEELEDLETKVYDVVLLYMTFYGSPVGAVLGMYCCCCPHKLKHNKFMINILPLMVFNMLWVFIFFIVAGRDV